MKGQVRNYSLKDLWVLERSAGQLVARRLRPSWQSPRGLDCVAFKAVDGTPIDGHGAWIELIDDSVADVVWRDGELAADCVICFRAEDDKFGAVIYDYSGNWGEPI